MTGLRVQLDGLMQKTEGTGFAASNSSSFSLPFRPDTAEALVLFLQIGLIWEGEKSTLSGSSETLPLKTAASRNSFVALILVSVTVVLLGVGGRGLVLWVPGCLDLCGLVSSTQYLFLS